ncbi:polycystin-1-like protein 2 [Heptranchias perlo]|uniref:polycystin-1-like protein 2 n=1 Tax=Heptranchias perlo TaxID=212740 RepID=UPI00355A8221
MEEKIHYFSSEAHKIDAAPCLQHQKAFQSSCYEFVEIQLNFSSAQGWCKRGGGHLAFIKDEVTSLFLKQHISTRSNRWIGLPYSIHDLIPESNAKALTWLDRSTISYSNWKYGEPSSSPANCTYIYKLSGYLNWAMSNCNNVFSFICEFDSQVLPGDIYSIFHIIIPLEWQLDPYSGTFSCTVYTGGDKIFYAERQDQSFTVAHVYKAAGLLNTISIKCRTRKGHWAIGKTNVMFEPINKTNGMQCYSPSQLDTTLNCTVRYGDTLWIQTESNNGFDVTYNVSIGNIILHASTLLPGVIPIDQSSQFLIGPGQHHVTVYATNDTGSVVESQNLTINLLVEISGLEAVLESSDLQLGRNASISVSVSQGAPISLQFDFIDAYNILSYTMESSNGKLPVYKFPMHQEGIFLVTVTASNILSIVRLAVGYVTVTNNPFKSSVRITRGRCSRPDVDATERLLQNLPNSEDFFSDLPEDELMQVIENVLQNFSEIAMNSSSMKGVEKANTFLNFITSHPDKLTVASQDIASNSLLTLSDKLENLLVLRPSDIMRKLSAAKYGLYGIDNLINASVATNSLDVEKEKMSNISEILLASMDKIYSSLESLIHEEDPVFVLHASSFSILLNRYNSSELESSRINTSGTNPFSCTFPNSTNLQDISDDRVQIKMVNYRENPLIWLEQSNVSGPLTNITLSSNGNEVKIENLSETFEIILPRSNTTQLFPATFTTFRNPVIQRFHVTDTESAIIISVETEPVTSVQLYLGYGYKPNDTLYEFETSFIPQYSSEAEDYSWIIHPEMLMGRNGTYYLAAKPLLKSNISEINATTFTIHTFNTKCLYWNEIQHYWSTHGCKVGPRSSLKRTQCLCNHLSLFATSFLVLDVTETVKLFSQVKDNSAVVSLVAGIVGVYIILVIWARTKDRQDLVKVKRTVLADNDPFAKYCYLVKVFTGHRRGAGTTSEVVITLYGSEGHSDSHHLIDPKKPVFKHGSVDEFLLATPFPLGNLTSIRLWHNNSGSSPSWYINHVIIQDPKTGQQWYFFCNCWLAVDVGEFVLDKIFPFASDAEMKDFRNLFFMKTAESLTDQHIWFSVVARPPRSSFTRVQRVSCCFSLLLCTMLTNIMFWGTASNETEQKEDLGKCHFSWRELIIGIESAFIIFPVNLVIVQIFRHVRPKPIEIKKIQKKSGVSQDSSECQQTPESLMMDIKGIASCLPGKLKDTMPTLEDDISNADDMNKLLVLIADIIQHYNEIEHSETHRSTVPNNENDSSADCGPDQQSENSDSTASNAEQNEDNDSTYSNPEKQRDQIMRHFFHYVHLLLKYVETELQEMGIKKFQNPYTQIHATDQVQKIIQFIKAVVDSDDSGFSNKREVTHRSEKKSFHLERLPWWFIYIGWVLVFATSGVSAFFTMLYSLDYENDSSADCGPDQQSENSDSTASNAEQNEDNDSTYSNPEKQRDQIMRHFFHYVHLLLKYVETELQEMGIKKFQNPYTQIHATDQVQKIIQFIKAVVDSDDSGFSNKREVTHRSEKKSFHLERLPWWFIYIGWVLVFATSGVSAFFTMLYSLDYGKKKSIQWLISMIVSFLQSVFIIQPIKVLLVAAFVALIIKKIERNENDEGYSEDLQSTAQPPSLKNVEEMKALRVKEKKMYSFIKDVIAHVGFLVSLSIIAYGERSPHSFYLNKALNDSFTKKFNGSMTINNFYIWADEILLPNLYGPYKGFITDGNSKLVGSPRIRQVRVKPAPCPVPTRLVDSIKECRAPYSYGDEDMSDFGSKRNLSVNTDSSWLGSTWQYQSESQLNGYPVWGKLAVYQGGGYVADLGTENKIAASVIKYLKDNSWVDMYTRAIFVEFTVYNANVNLFCVVTLMLEMKAIGVFLGNMEMEIIRLYQYVDQNYSSIIGAQIVFMLIVIYYMVAQGKLLKQKRLKYFWNKWNLIDMAIILCSWSAFGLHIKRVALGTRVIEDYLQNRDRFVNFYETAIIDSGLGYVIAFLVSLATVKFWNLLHLNPKMHLITSSLQRAWSNLLGLLVIMLVLLVSYSSVCNLVLGLNLSSYRTFSSAVLTIIRLQLGVFNYDEVLRANPILGAFIISTCVIFMTFILINVFVSALLVSFSEERHHPMPLEDEEIVDLLMMKLCGIIGVQWKKKEEPQSNAEAK